MTIQAILTIDGKVFAAEDFPSESSAKKWAESYTQMDHYQVALFRDADDDPYERYYISSKLGMHR